MELKPEELKKVSEYADLLLTIEEIAVLMDKDVLAMKDEYQFQKNPLYLTYTKAVLERKIKLRKPVLKMAELGSPNAEIIANTYLTDQQISANET
ncbi:MAG: hypothetical protein JXR34_11555 [Bacteroidales bacterium]|nr:hypothetical protein [Bacteroidales bacterium]